MPLVVVGTGLAEKSEVSEVWSFLLHWSSSLVAGELVKVWAVGMETRDVICDVISDVIDVGYPYVDGRKGW